MATNRKKDAATLYEVLGRTSLKSQKKDQPSPRPPEPVPSQAVNNRTPPRAPITGSIRPPPSPASPAGDARDIRNPPAGAQLSPEPVLLDQILARFRPWILVVVAGIVALILALVVLLSPGTRTPQKPLEPVPVSPVTPTPGLIQPHLEPANNSPPSVGQQTVTQPVSPEKQAARQPRGRVIPASQVTRSPDRWYLVILTTLPQYARRAAEFIARHGVSVTIENGPHNFKCVIAVQGFRRRAGAAAIAFRRKVVHIGTLLPDARRAGRSDFNTAYYAHVQRSQ